MKKNLFLLAAVLLALVVIGCDSFTSKTDPSSPPDEIENEKTGAWMVCQTGDPALGISFWLDNGYQRVKLETIKQGDDAGLAPPKMLTYEQEFFATDPPWFVSIQVEATTGSCGGPVSPQPTCVSSQSLARVPLEWKEHKDYGKYLEANATILCN